MGRGARPSSPRARRPSSDSAPSRAPLNPQRVLQAALALADAEGLEAVTMRRVAERLGVEAMSLYRHVANKDGLLDGLVELVMAEMSVPPDADWVEAMHARALSMRHALLRHRWAAQLIEGRLTPGPARLRLHEASLRALRGAGFSVELAYSAILTLDSYIYGFVMQELAWPFEAQDRTAVIDALRPAVPMTEFPHMAEVMAYVEARAEVMAGQGASAEASYTEDFLSGLDLILDGLMRTQEPPPIDPFNF